MQLRKPAPVLMGAVAALSLFTGACATKKHVREAIAPVQTQVGELQKTTQQQQTAIGDLDRNVSKADEHAMEADRKATAAAQSADKANQAAMTAQQQATAAGQSAQAAMNRAESVASSVNSELNNLDNYQLVTTEKVYFRVNRSDLSKDEQAKLDQAVQQIQTAKNYVIEVAGYTDRSGNKAANVELARRRAEAVVRYLGVQHDVPLRKIYTVGVGSDFPDADNKTRAARKENRRVDIKVYALNLNGGQGNQPQAGSNPTNPMPAQTPAATPQQQTPQQPPQQ